jgi:transmembrane sensor
MSKRDFVRALADADRELGTFSLSPDADRRILDRARGPKKARRKTWVFVVAPLAAAAAVVATWIAVPPANVAETIQGLRFTRNVPGATIVEEKDLTLQIEGGAISLFDDAWGAEMIAAGGARIRREAGDYRVVGGRVEMKIQKREQKSAKIFVSGGVIEVLGTRFTIDERGDRGRVELHEGKIRFTRNEGEVVELSPAESLEWPEGKREREEQVELAPREPEEPRAPVKSMKTKKEPHAPIEEVDAILAEIDLLRSRGEYPRAVETLERALKTRRLRNSARERLSFELGSILTHQLNDPARACRHWQSHASQFPKGRYELELVRAREHLKCSR